MAPHIGRLESIGIGKEASRGVGVPAAYTIPRMGYSFDDKANKAVSSEVLGHIGGNGPQAIVTQRFSEGNIDGEINANSFGLIALSLLGSESVATVSGAKKHSLTLSNSNQHQTLSIYLDSPIQDRLFKGSVIDSLQISVNPEDIAKFSAGYKGRKGVDTSFAPAPAADYKFVGRDAVIKVATDTSGLAAASALSLKEITLQFQKNADYDFKLGTLEPENIPNKQMTVTGTLTLDYEDNVMRDYMTAGSYRALSFLLQNTRDTIGSNNPAVYFEFPVVDFYEWEANREPDSIVTQKINFRVLVDLSTGTPRLISDAYVINNVDAY